LANGTWRLYLFNEVLDDGVADDAFINGWDIMFSYEDPTTGPTVTNGAARTRVSITKNATSASISTFLYCERSNDCSLCYFIELRITKLS
jgi:hypothetical protein